MPDRRGWYTRRSFLGTAAAGTLAIFSGCSKQVETPEQRQGLRIIETDVIHGSGSGVPVDLTLENTGQTPKSVDIDLTLTHTDASGTIDRTTAVLIDAESRQTVRTTFHPSFFRGPPKHGAYRFEVSFAAVRDIDSIAAPPTLQTPAAIEDGKVWPAPRYDPGATGFQPATSAPATAPETQWTVEDLGDTDHRSGPIADRNRVYAGNPPVAIDPERGEIVWTAEAVGRTGSLALAEGRVVCSTDRGIVGLDAASGDIDWTAEIGRGSAWHGEVTAVDGQVIAWHPRTERDLGMAFQEPGVVAAIDATTGRVRWTVDTGQSLRGPIAVSDGVAVVDAAPLRAIDPSDGATRWTAPRREEVELAAVAHNTVFALEHDRLTALDAETGRPRWMFADSFVVGSSTLAVGSRHVFVSRPLLEDLLAIDARDGTIDWSVHPVPNCHSLTATDGFVLAQSFEGDLIGIDSTSGEIQWREGSLPRATGSIPVVTGTCYLSGTDRTVRALQ